MTHVLENKLINGIDVEALKQTIGAVEADPAQGQTRWQVTSRWQGGARSDHEVRGAQIGGEQIERRFLLKTDEPLELHGTNEHPNPQEYLLSALNACMMVGYAAVAGLMGIHLTKLEVEVEGDIDLRGFLGLAQNVRPGYAGLRQTVRIAGDGSAEQFAELHAVVQATSPNYFNVTSPIPVASDMVVES
jgi:uncharacterized OsmC-like protein